MNSWIQEIELTDSLRARRMRCAITDQFCRIVSNVKVEVEEDEGTIYLWDLTYDGPDIMIQGDNAAGYLVCVEVMEDKGYHHLVLHASFGDDGVIKFSPSLPPGKYYSELMKEQIWVNPLSEEQLKVAMSLSEFEMYKAGGCDCGV